MVVKCTCGGNYVLSRLYKNHKETIYIICDKCGEKITCKQGYIKGF